MKKVLFVCTGNICRSPTAEGILRRKIEEAGYSDKITVDSCAMTDWHIDKAPDPRSIQTARDYGLDISDLRGRQVSPDDFFEFDYIFGMTAKHCNGLRELAPKNGTAEVFLFLDHGPGGDVPDPYYLDNQGFYTVFDMLDEGCDAWIAKLGLMA